MALPTVARRTPSLEGRTPRSSVSCAAILGPLSCREVFKSRTGLPKNGLRRSWPPSLQQCEHRQQDPGSGFSVGFCRECGKTGREDTCTGGNFSRNDARSHNQSKPYKSRNTNASPASGTLGEVLCILWSLRAPCGNGLWIWPCPKAATCQRCTASVNRYRQRDRWGGQSAALPIALKKVLPEA